MLYDRYPASDRTLSLEKYSTPNPVLYLLFVAFRVQFSLSQYVSWLEARDKHSFTLSASPA